ncbi:ADP-ribosylation factor family-domain-containing protein [Mycena amicta]|nr:ADP-ribosylation factor family-domain-containing protein [Mycena amicta]
MGAVLSSPKSFEIVMLGLDDAGKTSILNRLHRRGELPKGVLPQTVSTIGSNIETIRHHQHRITVWDMGGMDKIRPLWRRFMWNGHAFAFVVDATAPERFVEARMELQRLAGEEYTPYPFLVLANKIDKAGAAGLDEIEEALEVREVFARHTEWPWGVMGVSAMTGEGLDEVLDWFVASVSHQHIAKHNVGKKSIEGQAW